MTDASWWEAHKVSLPEGQAGSWAIERFTVRPGARLQPYHLVYGRDCPPGDYTALVRYEDGSPEIGDTMDGSAYLGGHEVMTDLPGEIEDHREVMEQIRVRGGRILIHGLGLGLIVRFALAQPNVTLLVPTARHWPILAELLRSATSGSNLTTDAHLAAHAIEHGYTVYSNDRDFGRFEGLRWKNPLT